MPDLDAIYTQGRSLFDRGQIDAGMARLREAAHAGHGAASHAVAMLLASEVSAPEGWEYVLAYTGRAAKAGHVLAQRTLAFMAGDKDADAAIQRGEILGEDTWYRLHDAVKPADWLKPPVKKIVRDAPHIAVCEAFITPQMCDWICEQARPTLARAMVGDQNTRELRYDESRSNSDTRFIFPDTDLVLMLTANRINQALGSHFRDHEHAAVLHYTPGQEFKAHYDFMMPSRPGMKVLGQRHYTLLIYLNDDYEGGQTVFPYLDFSFKGRKGDALLFRNVDKAGQPDRLTLHAGSPTTSGEKWLFSQWVREPQY